MREKEQEMRVGDHAEFVDYGKEVVFFVTHNGKAILEF